MPLQSFDDLIQEDYLNEVLAPAEAYSVEHLVQSKVNAQIEQGKVLGFDEFKLKCVGSGVHPENKYFYKDSKGQKKLSHLGKFYQNLSAYTQSYTEDSLNKLLLSASDVYVDRIYADRAYAQTAFLEDEIKRIVNFLAGALGLGVKDIRDLLSELGRIKLKFENYSIVQKRAEYERLEKILMESTSPQEISLAKADIVTLKGLSLQKDNNELLLMLVGICLPALFEGFTDDL